MQTARSSSRTVWSSSPKPSHHSERFMSSNLRFLRDDATGIVVDLQPEAPVPSDLSFGPPLAALVALESGATANVTEQRRVGHYWLRDPDRAPSPDLSEAIRESWKAIAAVDATGLDTILLVGIGGSALGPAWPSRRSAHHQGRRLPPGHRRSRGRQGHLEHGDARTNTRRRRIQERLNHRDHDRDAHRRGSFRYGRDVLRLPRCGHHNPWFEARRSGQGLASGPPHLVLGRGTHQHHECSRTAAHASVWARRPRLPRRRACNGRLDARAQSQTLRHSSRHCGLPTMCTPLRCFLMLTPSAPSESTRSSW